MKAFAYHAPKTVAEAVALLAEYNERARPMAGGTDLLVQMRLGLFSPELIVDVKKIPELNELSYDPQNGLTIGAAVPCYRVYEHPDVIKRYPGLVDAAKIIGGIAVQGRATLGGNLCNAAPSGDSIPAMIVLGATCLLASPQGTRRVSVESFCTGPRQTVLGKGEMLVSLHFPPPAPCSGARYLRFIPRSEMDIAVVGVGASLALTADYSEIKSARIAVGAVAPIPLLVEKAGAALVGKAPGEEAWAQAAALAQEAALPISDTRGTIDQHRHLVGVLTKRALRDALRRAKGEPLDGS